MKISESISIAQSPDRIWTFWLPVSTDAQWRDGIVKAEWTSQPPYGIGSSGAHYSKDGGVMSWKVIRWEEGRYFEFIHTEGRLKGSVASYHVEPEKQGSLVSLHADMTGPFIIRIILNIMKAYFRKSIRTDLKRLKDLMENTD